MRGRLVLTGRRAVAGLVFGANASGRVLDHWQRGSRLDRLDDGELLLRFPEPTMMTCETAAGLAVEDRDRRLAAVPTAAMADAPAGDLVVATGGELVGRTITAPIDPGTLLDLSEWRVLPRPPAPEPTMPPAPRRPAAEPVLDPRTALARVGPPDPQARAAFDRLAQEAGRSRGPAADRRGTGPAGGAAGAPPAPGLLDRVRAWLGDTPQRRRAHERYLDELQRLFAAGRVDDALRRAIPLGADGQLRSWSIPAPRDDLRISPWRTGGASTADVAPDVQLALRRQYRAAYEQLDLEGRTLDAAFVLAELLDSADEASAYLERHGELELAAQLAEARSTDPALIVRLWWLAGRRDHAITIARRHGCFAQAIGLLERAGDTAPADELRRTWASQLLAGGDLVGTVDALAPLTDPRSQAMRSRVFEIGLERRGPIRARLLARHLRSGADTPHPALEELTGDPAASDERRILTADLLSTPAPVDHPLALRPLARWALQEDHDHKRVQQLVALTGDALLRADLPTMPRAATTPPPGGSATVPADDRGLTPFLDARALPDGTIIAAAGGHEIQLRRADGRILRRFDVPAHALVPSDHGTHVLAIRLVAPGLLTVWVLDLLERRHRVLGEIAGHAWASTYDGANWFLASGAELWMLDILDEGPATTWQLGDAGGTILAVARSTNLLSIATHVGQSPDGNHVALRTTFDLPSIRERSHSQTMVGPTLGLLPDGSIRVAAVDGDDRTFITRTSSPDPSVVVAAVPVSGRGAVFHLELEGVETCATHLDHGVLITADQLGRIERYDASTGRRLPSVRSSVV